MNILIKIGTEDDTGGLFEVLEILQPEAAALVAMYAREVHMVAMQDDETVIEGAMAKPKTFAEAEMNSHLTMAEAAQKVRILSLIDALVEPLGDSDTRLAKVKRGVEQVSEDSLASLSSAG